MTMDNSICIYGHLGLGDHVVCNSIYRQMADSHDFVVIPVKYANVPSVQFMLREVMNIVIRPVYGDEDMFFFVQNIWKGKTLPLGSYAAAAKGFDKAKWDQEFYRHADMPFTDRWDKWICVRNPSKEEKPKAECAVYAFLHQDEERGYLIPENALALNKKVKPVIQPHRTETLFNWWNVIEEAAEIHVICSSFSLFIDSIELPNNPQLFLYDIRPEALPTYRKQWFIHKPADGN